MREKDAASVHEIGNPYSKEIEHMSGNTEDNRALSETTVKKLENGLLDCFLKEVKNRADDLSLCFRGNHSPDKIDIYHQGHIACSIILSQARQKIRFEFSLGHIDDLISESEDDLRKKAQDNPYIQKFKSIFKEDFKYKTIKLNRKKGPEAYKLSTGSLEVDCKRVSKEFSENIIEYSIEIVKKYMGKNTKLEKKCQHDIFNKLNKTTTGFFAYDREFKQWFCDVGDIGKKIFLGTPQNSESQEKMKSHELSATWHGMTWHEHIKNLFADKERAYSDIINEFGLKNEIQTLAKHTNEPDILAIRFRDGQPQALVFIEVKSTREAMDIEKNERNHGVLLTRLEPSGPLAHMARMYAYSTYRDEKFNFMDRRRKEAHDILEQYKKLGLRGLEKYSIPALDAFLKLPAEHMLLLTDTAIDAYKDKTDTFQRLAKMFDCDICKWTGEKVLKGSF